jgi:Mrp family chromosome partitioning ATPase
MAARTRRAIHENLRRVKHVVAVASCKGGVGKSTVAVNLALGLARRGLRVAMLDADVYGPSLPTMLRADDPTVRPSPDVDGSLAPVRYAAPTPSGGETHDRRSVALDCMSYGWVNPAAAPGAGGQGAAVVRGPLVSRLITQLVTKTAWGEQDVLVVDMPPGTGDIQLTLCQELAISAAVVVTTPQKLSYVDVLKGMEMFAKLAVPTVALVENMAFFDSPSDGVRHYPFGRSDPERMVQMQAAAAEADSAASPRVPSTCELPMSAAISEAAERGAPVMVEDGGALRSPEAVAYAGLAADVESALRALGADGATSGAARAPQLSWDEARGTLGVALGDALRFDVAPATLRRACRCALAYDELSGAPLLDPTSVPESLAPISLSSIGNYAVRVHWNERGFASSCDACIYTADTLAALEKDAVVAGSAR